MKIKVRRNTNKLRVGLNVAKQDYKTWGVTDISLMVVVVEVETPRELSS